MVVSRDGPSPESGGVCRCSTAAGRSSSATEVSSPGSCLGRTWSGALLSCEADLAECVAGVCCGTSPAAMLASEVLEPGDVALGLVMEVLEVLQSGGVGRGALLPLELVACPVGVVELFGVEDRHGVEDVLLVAGEPVELVIVEAVEVAGQVSVDLELCVVVGGSSVGSRRGRPGADQFDVVGQFVAFAVGGGGRCGGQPAAQLLGVVGPGPEGTHPVRAWVLREVLAEFAPAVPHQLDRLEGQRRVVVLALRDGCRQAPRSDGSGSVGCLAQAPER